MSVWMSVVKFLVKSLLLVYSFSPILTKVGTHVLCANVHKTVEQISKIFGEFS